ncbi:MAG: 4a-hydroxytetrahydrobiopterin dehydratase [Candidatus Kuenenia sp.]|nr:4a-hydroxytetrahydrobiopterin dehydratase [Candidatus Kuenenia hertensis]
MSELASKKCVPCQGGIPPLKGNELMELQKHVSGWDIIEEHHLYKSFKFPNFTTALDFTNKVGEIAEAEGHHPRICLTWGKVEIKIFTHKIDGLTESDFILAAKIDTIK